MSLYPLSRACPKCGAKPHELCSNIPAQPCDERWDAFRESGIKDAISVISNELLSSYGGHARNKADAILCALAAEGWHVVKAPIGIPSHLPHANCAPSTQFHGHGWVCDHGHQDFCPKFKEPS